MVFSVPRDFLMKPFWDWKYRKEIQDLHKTQGPKTCFVYFSIAEVDILVANWQITFWICSGASLYVSIFDKSLNKRLSKPSVNKHVSNNYANFLVIVFINSYLIYLHLRFSTAVGASQQLIVSLEILTIYAQVNKEILAAKYLNRRIIW